MFQLQEAGAGLPGEIDFATQGADNTQSEVVKLQHRKDGIYHQVADHVRNQTEVCKDLNKATSDIQQLQRYLAYLQLIDNVEKIRYSLSNL